MTRHDEISAALSAFRIARRDMIERNVSETAADAAIEVMAEEVRTRRNRERERAREAALHQLQQLGQGWEQ